jgi:hypothetical protein
MYDTTSVNTYASTNGFLSLLRGSSQYEPSQFPVPYLPNNTVAPFFDDLFLLGGASPQQGIWYQLNTAQTKITYEWYISRSGNTNYPFHFTVAYDSAQPGIFVFSYYATGGPSDNGATCAVGMQGSTFLFITTLRQNTC